MIRKDKMNKLKRVLKYIYIDFREEIIFLLNVLFIIAIMFLIIFLGNAIDVMYSETKQFQIILYKFIHINMFIIFIIHILSIIVSLFIINKKNIKIIRNLKLTKYRMISYSIISIIINIIALYTLFNLGFYNIVNLLMIILSYIGLWKEINIIIKLFSLYKLNKKGWISK